MLRLDIRGVNAYPLEKEVLTEGRVGLEISFTFSSEWDGLTKIAVFEGAKTIDVALVDDHCVVPHEALAQSGAALRIGVYGQNTAGDIVIPTVWAKFGQVQPAARLSEETTTPPTPSVVAQILAAAEQAEAIAQSVRDDADAGVFNGKSLFWCTYLRTTLSDVLTAVNDGLLPVMIVSGMLFVLGSYTTGGEARFYSTHHGTSGSRLFVRVVDSNDEWSYAHYNLGDYSKPGTGIPKNDLAQAVKDSLDLADSAYQKPGTGIPKADLASDVQASLGKADTALQSAPVTSVNNKAGAVTLDADDVGAIEAPVGGAVGQVLKKTADGTEWADESAIGLYWCTYLATSYAEVMQAVNDGLLPVMIISGALFTLGSYTTSAAKFYCTFNNSAGSKLLVRVVDTNDDWTAENYVLGDYSLPAGGTAGQVLKKTADGTEWANESGGGATEVFWATYGTTTSAEIEAAYQAGKAILMEYPGLFTTKIIYVMTFRNSATNHTFTNEGVYTHSEIECVSDTWGSPVDYEIAPLSSPDFTGSPTAPTASADADNTLIATTAFVNRAVNKVKVFWATYNTTTSAELAQALSDGKLVLCERNSIIYRLVYQASFTDHIFVALVNSTEYRLECDNGTWSANTVTITAIPAGGNAGECLAKNSSSDYDLRWRTINDWTPAGLIRTSGGTAAKVAEWSVWSDTQYPSWLLVTVGNSNSYAGAITLKVNGKGPYPIYINGAASSSSNYTLPAGSYFVYFDGTNFYFDTTGKIPGDITGHASGDIAAPASPTTGDFLCWNGSAWAATSMSAWQGGSY